MKDSARYAKIVEWSEEDQCYIGTCPGLIHGGCHGSDERAVFEELCQIVDEAIELYRQDGKPLPPPTSSSWDRQFEADARAGKLDPSAERARRDHAEGRTKEL